MKLDDGSLQPVACMTMGAKLLIIDDEPEILETTRWAFETAGYEVHTAADGREALEKMKQVHPELLLIDYKLPQMTGVELLRAAKALDPGITVVMITGLTHQSDEIESECRESGAAGFLQKPLQMDKVLSVVKEALHES